MPANRKVAVVTGANKGIGYYIARNLLQAGMQVIMACRNNDNAVAAVKKLQVEAKEAFRNCPPMCVPLDLADAETIDHFVPNLAKIGFSAIDILVNNAGFAFHTDSTEPTHVQAAKTVGINFFGVASFTEKVIPIMNEHGRIIFVGSRAGILSVIRSEEIRAQFASPSLTIPQLTDLVRQYLELTKTDSHTKQGWPNTTYGLSKAAMNTYSRVLAQRADLVEKHITSNACCPGWCRTDMTCGEGYKSAEEGADSPTWLATAPEVATVSGKFFGERAVIDLAAAHF